MTSTQEFLDTPYEENRDRLERLEQRVKELQAENERLKVLMTDNERIIQNRNELIRDLQAENDLYEDALDRIISELGVPTIDYPAPVANAWAIAYNARHRPPCAGAETMTNTLDWSMQSSSASPQKYKFVIGHCSKHGFMWLRILPKGIVECPKCEEQKP